MSTKTVSSPSSYEAKQAELARAFLVTLNLYPSYDIPHDPDDNVNSVLEDLSNMIPGLLYADLVALNGLVLLLLETPEQISQAVWFCQKIIEGRENE